MRDATQTYWTRYDYTHAFDSFVADSGSAAVVAALLQGKGSAICGLQCMRDGFLGKWGSTRSMTPATCPGIGEGLKQAASLLGRLPAGSRIDNVTDAQLERLVAAFDELDKCEGVGATIASKIMAALLPATAVMWDTPIAAAYGFAHSTSGYRRFLLLMREFAAQLRTLGDGTDVESYVKPSDRAWKAPLAKLIDEWHWVRITKKIAYDRRIAPRD